MDTEIMVILDRSGSMGKVYDDTIGGFNEWLKTVAEGQKQGDDVRISVTIFDTVVEQTVVRVPIRACPALGTTANPFVPRGGTALLDAVGRTLTEHKDTITKGKRALAVIITDGGENSSREWSSKMVGDLIAKLDKSKRWSFVYLGSGIDAWANARTFAPQTLRAQTFSYDPDHTRTAYRANAHVTSDFLGTNSMSASTLGAQSEAAMDSAMPAPKTGRPKKITTPEPSR